MTKKTKKPKEEAVLKEEKTEAKTPSEESTELFSRIFYTILFAIIGWMSLWVFSFVVLIQFGFLLITGQVNTNLKGFNQEVGLFLFDMIKYLSFQTNDKPFPFRDWPYDQNSEKANNSELNETQAVKASK